MLQFEKKNRGVLQVETSGTPTAPALVAQIRSDIISGVYKPDERLKFAFLAKRYSCSFGSLRESLTSLVSEGFVTSQANKGFAVAPVSSAELLEVTEHYIDLEKRAIVSAIDNGDDVWESNIVASHHRLKFIENQTWKVRVELHDDWLKRHREFHWSLVSASEGIWLLRLRSMMFDQLDRYRFITKISSEGMGERKFLEHKQLMEATVNRNKEMVTKLIESHIRDTAERALALMPKYNVRMEKT